MDILYFILPLAALAFFIWFMMNRKKKRAEERNLTSLPIDLPKDFPYKYDTADAPYVASIVPVPQEALDAIKAGIEMQIRATQILYPNWTAVRTPYDYNVMIIASDATSEAGEPCLYYQVKNAEKQVTQKIKTAGTVIGTGTDNISPSNIVLASQDAVNWTFLDFLRNAARHESEHYAELFNDKAMFLQYAQQGDVHPHHPLPEENTMRGFANIEPAYVDSCLIVEGFEEDISGQKGRGNA